MYEVYYIGGPWDLTKRVFEKARPDSMVERVMYTAEKLRRVEGVPGEIQGVRMGEVSYTLERLHHNNREANREVYIAIFQGWES